VIDLDRLLRLRVVVARYGEMDVARWWNTKGQLGRLGAVTLARGFPRTHYFAQARSVFEVAKHRCVEIFNPPECVTLWHLDDRTEEEFDARWEHWLDNASDWTQFFIAVQKIGSSDLIGSLRSFELLSDADVEQLTRLRRSAEGRAVPLPGVYSAEDGDVTLLALGFGRGEPGNFAVPYMRKAEE
jgi:hypothetical protein